MFTLLRGLFTRKKDVPPSDIALSTPIRNVSLTLTDATQGEDKLSDLDPELRAIHDKIYTNPASTLTISEINVLMEKDLKLKPLTSGFFNLNKAMVDITVMEFTSINIVYDRSTDKVKSIDYTFVDAVNSTGAKLLMPAEAISELLVPITFKKDSIKC